MKSVFWNPNEESVSSRRVITVSDFSGRLDKMKSENWQVDLAL